MDARASRARAGYLGLCRLVRSKARRVFERIVETRAQQDNEQWHLLILQDLVQRRGLKQSLLLHRVAPWLIAFFYYQVSWLLFLVRPEWSYRLNADFEDHAEHDTWPTSPNTLKWKPSRPRQLRDRIRPLQLARRPVRQIGQTSASTSSTA